VKNIAVYPATTDRFEDVVAVLGCGWAVLCFTVSRNCGAASPKHTREARAFRACSCA